MLDALLDLAKEQRLIVLYIIVQLRLALKEAMFGIAAHQIEGGGKSVDRFLAGSLQRPQPSEVDVRVADASHRFRTRGHGDLFDFRFSELEGLLDGRVEFFGAGIAVVDSVEGFNQKQFAHVYRIIKEQRFGGYLLQKKAGDTFNSLYAFTLDECYPEDFAMSNYYTATFPESFFTKIRMCTIPTKDGRITLTDAHFKVVKNGDISETAIKNEEAFGLYLKKYFRLDLDRIKESWEGSQNQHLHSG